MTSHSNINLNGNAPDRKRQLFKRYVKVVSFTVLLLASGYGMYFANVKLEEIKRNSLPVLGAERLQKVAKFSFLNQQGKAITNDDVTGKICVVSYFFATCRGICPQMNKNMALVYKTFKGNKKVVLLSHTVDPVKDSVGALKQYSLRFDADPDQWMFLTGDKKKLYDMARYSYLISAGDDTTGIGIDADFIHDQQFTLVDGVGRIRGLYKGLDSTEINRLIGDINRLLAENK